MGALKRTLELILLFKIELVYIPKYTQKPLTGTCLRQASIYDILSSQKYKHHNMFYTSVDCFLNCVHLGTNMGNHYKGLRLTRWMLRYCMDVISTDILITFIGNTDTSKIAKIDGLCCSQSMLITNNKDTNSKYVVQKWPKMAKQMDKNGQINGQ